MEEGKTAAEETCLATVATAQGQAAKVPEFYLLSGWRVSGSGRANESMSEKYGKQYTNGSQKFDTPMLIGASELLEELESLFYIIPQISNISIP